ncbi:P-loop containing nucleoside triphosphate hydrolase protein [Syncephalastrum racemosum]|uniref:RNA helicase n=1 Tax=Syncephalastrum racemosum TaxID=13706 RepID=A0A1X2HVF4_SYNRA|nr:P-loop containing nucleoside triphosphate hydrolase protein [Syncephalastrum racemosum]
MSAKRPCSDPAGNDSRKKQQLESVAFPTESPQGILGEGGGIQATRIPEQKIESKTTGTRCTDPDEEPIKLFSSDQRLADLKIDEPTCIVCGKYGEYINHMTENDVCSLECRDLDTDMNGPVRQKPTSAQIIPGVSSGYVADNVHAKFTNYVETKEVAAMPQDQIMAMRKAHLIKVNGTLIPHPIVSFDQCRQTLGDTLLDNLEDMNWSMATSVQRQAVPAGLAGRDLFVVAPTSAGKTGAFVIPVLVHCQTLSKMHRYKRRYGPYALIMAPTRPLCEQIESTIKRLARGLPNTRTALLVGGVAQAEQLYRLRKGVQIVVGTPARILDVATYHPHVLRLWRMRIIIMDEADTLMGNTSKEVRQILGKMPDKLVRQYCYFSTTIQHADVMNKMMRRQQRVIEIHIGQRDEDAEENKLVKKLRMNTDVRQTVLWVENASKVKRLTSILNDPKYYQPPVVVFVESRLGAEYLMRTLQKRRASRHWRVIAIHSDMEREERNAILGAINKPEPEWDVVVATDILARGIDLPTVQLIINYDMASSLENYIQRVSRAARPPGISQREQHRRGWAITFLNEDHAFIHRALAKLLASRPPGQVTPMPGQLRKFVSS